MTKGKNVQHVGGKTGKHLFMPGKLLKTFSLGHWEDAMVLDRLRGGQRGFFHILSAIKRR